MKGLAGVISALRHWSGDSETCPHSKSVSALELQGHRPGVGQEWLQLSVDGSPGAANSARQWVRKRRAHVCLRKRQDVLVATYGEEWALAGRWLGKASRTREGVCILVRT